MSATIPPSRAAWEPLTPRGVAAFAGGSLRRLIAVQFVVTLLATASLVWFLEKAWLPVIRAAVQQLPEAGEISGQKLDWQGASPMQLAQNRFLGFSVDLYHSGQLGHEPHLQVEFGQNDLRIYSLLDYRIVEYPSSLRVDFNRDGVEPWWGAWHPYILLGVAAAMMLFLNLLWPVLATIYCLPVWLISLLERHHLGLIKSWRLAGAATMPGTLFLTLGILGYGLGWIDLIRLGSLTALSIVIGWIYLFVAPLFCPRTNATKTTGNPFMTEKNEAAKPTEPKAEKTNPFQS